MKRNHFSLKSEYFQDKRIKIKLEGYDIPGYTKCSLFGGVSEWPIEHAWKACKRESVSWVRIPPPPKFSKYLYIKYLSCTFFYLLIFSTRKLLTSVYFRVNFLVLFLKSVALEVD